MIVLPYTAVDIGLILPDVVTHTRECPEPLRLRQLQKAANDFCRRSYWWRQPKTLILTTVSGQDYYPTGMPDGIELAGLHSTWDDQGCELDVALGSDIDDQAPTTTSDTFKVKVWNLDSFVVTPAPCTTGLNVTGTVSFAPTQDSSSIPSFLFARWREAIADGAVAMLLEQPGMPWTKAAPQGMAAYKRNCYEQAISKAAAEHGPVKRAGARLRVQIADAGGDC